MLILETQQSSDVTYRLYDYDRPWHRRQLRPLHIEQSLDCIKAATCETRPPSAPCINLEGKMELIISHL